MLWTNYKTTLIELRSPRISEMSEPDQLCTITIREDMAIVVDKEISVPIISEKTTIKKTAVHIAKSTIILPKAVVFSKDSTAEVEGVTERRAMKCHATNAESMAIRELNATVANKVSKPKTRSRNEALQS
jgi:hypothetical protein